MYKTITIEDNDIITTQNVEFVIKLSRGHLFQEIVTNEVTHYSRIHGTFQKGIAVLIFVLSPKLSLFSFVVVRLSLSLCALNSLSTLHCLISRKTTWRWPCLQRIPSAEWSAFNPTLTYSHSVFHMTITNKATYLFGRMLLDVEEADTSTWRMLRSDSVVWRIGFRGFESSRRWQ